MIYANEIRVGNIYNRKHGKSWTQTVIDELIMGRIFTDERGYALNDFEPIELTPEILRACGLEKRFNNPDCNIWDSILKEPTRNMVFSLALIDKGWIYMTAPGAVPFKHLHQLQNLYRDLTGTELNYQV